MFLADAVANYVESLDERQLDAPLIALLYREGFREVHLVHGAYEFGKDLIASREEEGVVYQYCIQSKAGDIGLPGWRAVRPQIDEMRTGSVVHPAFDSTRPRKLVLATNGRLTGAAPINLQDYNEYHRGRGESPVEVWTLEALATKFEHFLVEGVPARESARTLELLGQLSDGRGNRGDLREYSTQWSTPGMSRNDRWGHRLTGAMLASAAAAAGREDLASQVACLLLESTYKSAPEGEREAELDYARTLFATHAVEFWQRIREFDPLDLVLNRAEPVASFVTHPVRTARAAECLSLIGIMAMQDRDLLLSSEILDYLLKLLASTPATSHIVSDEWSFFLLVTTTFLLAHNERDTAGTLLRQAAIWTLDKVEFGDGLAESGQTASVAIRQLLGSPYSTIRVRHNMGLYAFAVILDMSLAGRMTSLYEDVLHDLNALGGFAKIVHVTDGGQEQLIARLEYHNDGTPAVHHQSFGGLDELVENERWFDCFAKWSITRDRHIPGVISALLHQIQSK